ncbi:methyltransferase domain-containing protein [Rhodobaculum claviforme]|uniref:SAM-dependent methyltransferase n=1 Tax=Rhodobaculum claviforme TaxID=1549854 RepID=A0A934WHX0_9RHOB|nr:methyltransferase domain-containing protein [Rhodobaculum claviforme]MBK5926294.1 SAM-dependent methyltransferase [Rhodobaculum claviforme]
MTPPQLTDRPALARARARAARAAPALFLHAEAAAEIKERLTEVNRTFTNPAIVTGWPQAWQGVVPGARMLPDAPVLALEAGAHDLVVHAMALHWADDPVGQLVQCRRALRPDGLLLAVAPGGRTLVELRAALAEAESEVAGGLSPRVLPMAEIRDLGGLLQRAGLALPVADSVTLNASYADAFALMRDLRAMGEGNALAARPRRPAPRRLFAAAARRYAEAFATPDGRVRATFELIFLTGWAPDASQPQPLRPGSATARLADALGSSEHPLPDTVPVPPPGGRKS